MSTRPNGLAYLLEAGGRWRPVQEADEHLVGEQPALGRQANALLAKLEQAAVRRVPDRPRKTVRQVLAELLCKRAAADAVDPSQSKRDRLEGAFALREDL